jgi:hypothetical protein
MDEDRQTFCSSVVDSDSKGGEMRILLPLLQTIAERSLCTVASSACAESIFSKWRDYNLSPMEDEEKLEAQIEPTNLMRTLCSKYTPS